MQSINYYIVGLPDKYYFSIFPFKHVILTQLLSKVSKCVVKKSHINQRCLGEKKVLNLKFGNTILGHSQDLLKSI